MSTIKSFSVIYDPVNNSSTFTSGDTLQGRIILETNKEVKIDKLYIKCKGDANVKWSESNGPNNMDSTYSAHERYFKLKQIFIWDNSKLESGATFANGETYKNLVMPGHHTFPFSFKLPRRNMPSSFKGCHGSIKYLLEASLCRSWKLPQTVVKEFTFVSTVQENSAHLMSPLSGSVVKKMTLFTSGTASVRASTDKKGYRQGERIKVETHIENSSSRALKLKFKLEQKQTFTAQSRINHSKKVIFKAVEDPIPLRSKKTFTSRLKIPYNLDTTITGSSIIKVEYTLKVYLDVPFATDPEIIFPVVILPAGQYCNPQQSQVASPASQNIHESERRGSSSQPALGPFFNGAAAAAAFGPAPGLYPSMYTQPVNPDEPPPSYTDIFPDSNASASGFNPSPLLPSPPPYTTIDSLSASHPHTEEYPSAAGYWQSPANSEFYPTK